MNRQHLDQVLIRTLTSADVEEFKQLRLKALQDHPGAFGASFDDYRNMPLPGWLKLFEGPPGSFILGAFCPNLVGMVGFIRRQGAKVCHKGTIWGTYVSSEARQSGLGQALMEEALSMIRSQADVEQVLLTVTAGNESARSLYVKLGFVPYGNEKQALKIGDQYIDEELFALSLKAD